MTSLLIQMLIGQQHREMGKPQPGYFCHCHSVKDNGCMHHVVSGHLVDGCPSWMANCAVSFVFVPPRETNTKPPSLLSNLKTVAYCSPSTNTLKTEKYKNSLFSFHRFLSRNIDILSLWNINPKATRVWCFYYHICMYLDIFFSAVNSIQSLDFFF